MHQILEQIEADAQSRPSASEFEMAYQVRVAMDRIRFAIKHTEQFTSGTEPTRDSGLQLLDALERLETVDRRFQQRSRTGSRTGGAAATKPTIAPYANGKGAQNGASGRA
jgi:hypothetical protein